MEFLLDLPIIGNVTLGRSNDPSEGLKEGEEVDGIIVNWGSKLGVSVFGCLDGIKEGTHLLE